MRILVVLKHRIFVKDEALKWCEGQVMKGPDPL